MKNLQSVKTRQNTRTQAREITVSERLSNSVIGVSAFGGLAIGVWSAAAMVSGVVAAGGPVSLATSWFHAVVGA